MTDAERIRALDAERTDYRLKYDAEKKRAEKFKAACAEMRAALKYLLRWFLVRSPRYLDQARWCEDALSSSSKSVNEKSLKTSDDSQETIDAPLDQARVEAAAAVDQLRKYRDRDCSCALCIETDAILGGTAGKALLDELHDLKDWKRHFEMTLPKLEAANEKLRAVRDAGTRLSLAIRAPADDDGCWEICVACDIGEELAALRAALDAVKES